jgi:hypothetical protein
VALGEPAGIGNSVTCQCGVVAATGGAADAVAKSAAATPIARQRMVSP